MAHGKLSEIETKKKGWYLLMTIKIKDTHTQTHTDTHTHTNFSVRVDTL